MNTRARPMLSRLFCVRLLLPVIAIRIFKAANDLSNPVKPKLKQSERQ